MRTILICLLLFGCSSAVPLTPAHYAAAKKMCISHEGLRYALAYRTPSLIEIHARCEDGSVVKFIPRDPKPIPARLET